MNEKDKLIKVGFFNDSYNEILSTNIEKFNIYRSEGLPTHMRKRKHYDDNILIGIKLDSANNYLYVSTMHSVQESKIKRRLHSGRLKEITLDTKNKQ